MWLNSFSDDIDDFDWWSEQTREQAWEKSEKKWDWGKGMAWVQKTRKDEKKAQKDNDFLYEIVVEIIQNKEYDILIPFITDLLKLNTPSNILIWWISLIYDPAVYIIRTNYIKWNKEIIINKTKANDYKVIINYTKTEEIIEFNDNIINEAIKQRINEWIDDIMNIISYDPSSIITIKFFQQIKNHDFKDKLISYFVSIITLFLYKLNIVISKEKAFLYSEFILWELIKKLKTIKIEEIN